MFQLVQHLWLYYRHWLGLFWQFLASGQHADWRLSIRALSTAIRGGEHNKMNALFHQAYGRNTPKKSNSSNAECSISFAMFVLPLRGKLYVNKSFSHIPRSCLTVPHIMLALRWTLFSRRYHYVSSPSHPHYIIIFIMWGPARIGSRLGITKPTREQTPT